MFRKSAAAGHVGASGSAQSNTSGVHATRLWAETFLLRLISRCLHPASLLPLSEAIIFDDIRALRPFGAKPRSSILRALMKPSYYLATSGTTAGDAISPDSPDASILYQLLSESGRVVNERAWFEAFCAIVTELPTADRSGTTRGRKGSEALIEAALRDKVLQARFVRGAADLEFIGAFQENARKKGSVTRLMFD